MALGGWEVLKKAKGTHMDCAMPLRAPVRRKQAMFLSLLGLLAKIKCSICSYQLNI